MELARLWLEILNDDKRKTGAMSGRDYVEGLGGSSARSWEIIRQTIKDKE
jgi:hypothetical protein